jgi:signal transduction histidine kinase
MALWLDYGVRLLVIGLAAWLGARWLSDPMRRLAEASQALGQSLGRPADAAHALPRLDERSGTLEMRQTAQVFNAMSQRLDEQFKAQGLLTAAISHDLRTPLARMRLRLEQMSDEPQAASCIADLREMDGLVGSVLDLVRDQHSPSTLQRVDVLALVQALADDLGEQGLPVGVQGEAAVVLAQPAALKRVLSNLIGNALRHGGSAEVGVSTANGKTHVTVDDRGPGIPPGQIDSVFKPFYRLASSDTAGSTGSGLGLHIARDLLQRQGGQLLLANRPGGGLRAEVVLNPG